MPVDRKAVEKEESWPVERLSISADYIIINDAYNPGVSQGNSCNYGSSRCTNIHITLPCMSMICVQSLHFKTEPLLCGEEVQFLITISRPIHTYI